MGDISLRPVSRHEWEGIAPSFADYNYRQTWEFGTACAEKVGAISEHIIVRHKDEAIACADVRVKRIPLIKMGIAYVNGGPLTRKKDSKLEASLRTCLEALIEEYVRKRHMLLRICPVAGDPEWNVKQVACFHECGFLTAEHIPRNRTILMAINRPLGEIRAAMHQKWRNCLNSAEKQGHTVIGGQGLELFEEFRELYARLVERKGFTADLYPSFYQEVQAKADARDQFYVALVQDGARAVAGHVSSILGDTCVYLLGASDEGGMKTKASYLLQWHVIELARERGCVWYDLGGIDPESNPGVYQFKKRLGGMEVQAPGPFEMAPGFFKRDVVLCGEWFYRTLVGKRQ